MTAKDKEQETALVTLNAALATLDVERIQDIINTNLAGQTLDIMNLQKVKVPGGGALTWEIPSLEGEDSDRVIQGVIVYFTTPRGKWDAPLDQNDPAPPSCSSPDGVVGYGNPGGPCKTCKFNQWGSDPKGGRGKACKEKVLLFLYREGQVIPLVVQVPATSLKNEFNHRLALSSAGLRHWEAVTELTLVKDTSGSIPFSRIRFTVPKGGRLEPAAVERIQKYVVAIQPFLTQAAQQKDNDYLDPSDEDYNSDSQDDNDDLPF